MIFLILISILFSIFSTTVLSYVSMATPIGPWISPTLVLLGLLIFKFSKNKINNLVLSVVAGAPGGILATALGFSFPTLYFLDKDLFNSWLEKPLFFCLVLTFLCLACGLLAFWFANKFEKDLIENQNLKFPIAELTYKMIASSSSIKQSMQLLYGIISTFTFCVFQTSFLKIKSFIPRTIQLFSGLNLKYFSLPIINFDLFPLCWAIGFVTGHLIAVPLLVGTLSKIFFADVINNIFFKNLSNVEFMLAFCSGLVLFSAVFGLKKSLFKLNLISNYKKLIVASDSNLLKKFQNKIDAILCSVKQVFISTLSRNAKSTVAYKNYQSLFFIVALIFSIAFLTFFKFSFVSQLYLIVFSLVCTYQIVVIAGKIGLAQLGRFATLVMIPGMLIFNLNYVQIMLIATFVELCSGIATELLFGRKIGRLSSLGLNRIKIFQLIGLIVSAFSVGFVFFFFIKNLQLGSAELFAQRAQARALLINVKSFNFYVLLVGLAFGYFLQRFKFNPMLVLGGLLMPVNMVLCLLTGAFFKYITPKKYDLEPFWSGVFATQSIWILLKIIL